MNWTAVFSPLMVGFALVLMYQLAFQGLAWYVYLFVVMWIMPAVIVRHQTQRVITRLLVCYAFYFGPLLFVALNEAVRHGLMQQVVDSLQTIEFWAEIIADVSMANVLVSVIIYRSVYSSA